MSSSIYYGIRPHRCNNAPKIKNGVKMVSNQEKVMIIRKKKRCKPRKIKVCKKTQKISTHLLTVLIIGAIVQLEQRKRDKESEI